MRAAGAIEAGGEELAKKITDGWFDFDVAIASPDMMRVVGGLGRVSWPQGAHALPQGRDSHARCSDRGQGVLPPARLNIATMTVETSTARSAR